jgi:hypothetical protein
MKEALDRAIPLLLYDSDKRLKGGGRVLSEMEGSPGLWLSQQTDALFCCVG